MKPQALTDAGVGRALFTTRFRLSLQAGLMCLSVGAIPAFIFPYLLWFLSVSPMHVDLIRLEMLARVVSDTTPRVWRLSDPSGERRIVEVELSDGRFLRRMTPPQVRRVLAGPLPRADRLFGWIEISSLVSAILAFYAALRWLRSLGSGSQESQRVRGAASIVSGARLSQIVKRDGGGQYSLVDVALPKSAPMTGILLQGIPGSGKSLGFHDLLGQVFDKKRKCIIYDHSGEFFQAYFRPGKDVFFNPACVGSVPWSIFKELRYTYDADTLARAFLPPKSGLSAGPGAFFEDAARALFSVILLRLAQRGARNTRDIAKAFLEMPDDEMELLIEKSVASSAVGGDSKGQRQGVISSIAIYLNGIMAVQPGTWSIRDFLESPEDTRLFILGTEDTRAQFAPLYRLLLTLAFGSIAAKGEIVREDRYWFFLDECHTLGDIRLDEQLATLRKFGVCTVSGIQSETQFVSSMGKDRATTVANCFNTLLVLRANEPDMQERTARRLGKIEMDTVSRNQALAVSEWRDGAGLNKSEHEKWLVMPSEIGALDNCTGWLKLVGTYPAGFVDYRSWTQTSAGKCRADKFVPVVPLPPRDPEFVVLTPEQGDPFGKLKEQLKSQKAAGATQSVEASGLANASGAAPAAGVRIGVGGSRNRDAPKPALMETPRSDEPPKVVVDTVQAEELKPGTAEDDKAADQAPEQEPRQDRGAAVVRPFDELRRGQTLGLDFGPEQ